MADYSYKDRVRREQKELEARCIRLRAFISAGSVFETLPEDERGRLIQQLYHMDAYDMTLHRRIAWFDSKDFDADPCDDNPCGR